MRPHKIDLPRSFKSLEGSALHVEAWMLGECRIIIAREDLADARRADRDFRWHLSIAHHSRLPTWEEVGEARKLLPEDVHFAMPFPHRAYWLNLHEFCFHLFEVKDENLSDQWEYDAIEARKRGGSENWVDAPPGES